MTKTKPTVSKTKVKNLTKKKLQELAGIAGGYGGKVVGFIGGIPVIERDDVPEGVMYVIPETSKYLFKDINAKK